MRTRKSPEVFDPMEYLRQAIDSISAAPKNAKDLRCALTIFCAVQRPFAHASLHSSPVHCEDMSGSETNYSLRLEEATQISVSWKFVICKRPGIVAGSSSHCSDWLPVRFRRPNDDFRALTRPGAAGTSTIESLASALRLPAKSLFPAHIDHVRHSSSGAGRHCQHRGPGVPAARSGRPRRGESPKGELCENRGHIDLPGSTNNTRVQIRKLTPLKFILARQTKKSSASAEAATIYTCGLSINTCQSLRAPNGVRQLLAFRMCRFYLVCKYPREVVLVGKLAISGND